MMQCVTCCTDAAAAFVTAAATVDLRSH